LRSIQKVSGSITPVQAIFNARYHFISGRLGRLLAVFHKPGHHVVPSFFRAYKVRQSVRHVRLIAKRDALLPQSVQAVLQNVRPAKQP
jgi:hypothetical protein